MKKIILLISLWAFSSACYWAAHPLKMCVCDVKYQAKSEQLNLRFKFFWDDLEATLEKQTHKNLTLTQISPENDKLLADFVRSQFHLKINDADISLKYVRSEIQDLVLLVEFTGTSVKAAESYHIDLTNEILLDVFPDQYNIVRFDFFGNGNLETMRFERKERHLTKQI